MQLFEYAVVFRPFCDCEDDETEGAKIIVPITPVLASNTDQVKMIAHRAIPDKYMKEMDNLVVLVRLFK